MRYFFILLFFVSSLSAAALDSMCVLFGVGLAKPNAVQVVENNAQGVALRRELATIPTLQSSVLIMRKRGLAQYGMEIGAEGEIFATNRFDGTHYSVAHADFTLSYNVFTMRNSSLGYRSSLGWGTPVFSHDEAVYSESWGGPRVMAALQFQRDGNMVELSVSRTWIAFEHSDSGGETVSKWNIIRFMLTMYWGWLYP